MIKVNLLVSKLPDLNSWTLVTALAVTVALQIINWNHPVTMQVSKTLCHEKNQLNIHSSL